MSACYESWLTEFKSVNRASTFKLSPNTDIIAKALAIITCDNLVIVKSASVLNLMECHCLAVEDSYALESEPDEVSIRL